MTKLLKFNYDTLYESRKCAVVIVPVGEWRKVYTSYTSLGYRNTIHNDPDDCLAFVDDTLKRGMSLVFVRREILDIATPFELRCLLAHEFAHIALGQGRFVSYRGCKSKRAVKRRILEVEHFCIFYMASASMGHAIGRLRKRLEERLKSDKESKAQV